MTGFKTELKVAFRTLAKEPLFSLAVILTLGLGIGVNSAAFSLLNAVILKPLPVSQPDRLVNLYTTRPDGSGFNPHSYPDYQDLIDRQDVFEGLLGYGAFLGAISEGDRSETVFGEVVTDQYFKLLGIEAQVGRTLGAVDGRRDGDPAVVISDRLWRVRFGSDPGMLGRGLLVNGRRLSVVGVAPKNFDGLVARGVPIDLWVGWSQVDSFRQGVNNREDRWLHVKGRLKQGVALARVNAFLDNFAATLENEYPESTRGRRFVAIPSSKVVIHPEGDGPLLLVAGLLMGAVVLLLGVICSNLANLFLARGFLRNRQSAIRQALGAGRWRLFSLPLIEAAVLAGAGGLVGLTLTLWSSRLLLYATPPLPVPMHFNMSADWRVLLFVCAATLGSGVLLGFLSGVQSFRINLNEALKEGSRSSQGKSRKRWSKVLLAPQLAFSVLILVLAGLFTRSVSQAGSVDVGFNTTSTAMTGVELRLAGYEGGDASALLDRLVDRLELDSRVARAAVTNWIPVGALFGRSAMTVWREGVSSEVASGSVGPGFLETLEIPVIQGRGFDERDFQAGAESVLVSETMARVLWPAGRALGARFRIGGEDGPWKRVVGITRDAKVQSLGESPQPFLYTPLVEGREDLLMVVVRGSAGSSGLVSLVRDTIGEMDPRIPIVDAMTFQDHLDVMVYPFRMAAGIGSFLGLSALCLALVGLYGMIALTVSQRMLEFGIRLALGATGRSVVFLLLRETLPLVSVAMAAGLALAAGLSEVLRDFVFGVSPTDPLVFTTVPALLLVAMVGACLVPSLRAVRVDPAGLLRSV